MTIKVSKHKKVFIGGDNEWGECVGTTILMRGTYGGSINVQEGERCGIETGDSDPNIIRVGVKRGERVSGELRGG